MINFSFINLYETLIVIIDQSPSYIKSRWSQSKPEIETLHFHAPRYKSRVARARPFSRGSHRSYTFADIIRERRPWHKRRRPSVNASVKASLPSAPRARLVCDLIYDMIDFIQLISHKLGCLVMLIDSINCNESLRVYNYLWSLNLSTTCLAFKSTLKIFKES